MTSCSPPGHLIQTRPGFSFAAADWWCLVMTYTARHQALWFVILSTKIGFSGRFGGCCHATWTASLGSVIEALYCLLCELEKLTPPLLVPWRMATAGPLTRWLQLILQGVEFSFFKTGLLLLGKRICLPCQWPRGSSATAQILATIILFNLQAK